MPRAMWSGAISFGLVNIPIKLYTAVSRKSVHFNQLDSRTGSRIRYQKVSAATGEEVPSEAIVKGYELSSGDYVTVEDDELAGLDPEASRTIDIEQFIELADIDPVFYDSAYHVAPDKATLKPYALLVQAMEESGKVAIARFVMRSKQYLCAIRPKDGALLLSTMVYADELNDPAEIGEIAGLEDVEVTDRELTMARQLVESLSDDFEPERFEDTYRTRVLELIERKAAGDDEIVAPPTPVAEDKVVDLMAALEASVREAKAARTRHPAARGDASGTADTADTADAAEEEAESTEAAPRTGKRKAKSAKSTGAGKAAGASKARKSSKRATPAKRAKKSA
jgi:DNA end-binding protein Ku